MSNDSLGDRIKKNYESRAGLQLTRRTPVIIRLDGKAFHTYTRGCKKPYDTTLMQAMDDATVLVAQECQGFKMGYVQSDEVSLLLTDYEDITTDAWFDYKIQKMCSVASSAMTAHFNEIMRKYHPNRLALFDARCFNIPENEVANYFLWRALDWERNSINMLAQAHFSHKELHGKRIPDLHDMLYTKGINWATDTSERERNGCWLSRTRSKSNSITPDYATIQEFLTSQLRRVADE